MRANGSFPFWTSTKGLAAQDNDQGEQGSELDVPDDSPVYCQENDLNTEELGS